ncbi:MAG: hypothetical protein WCS03_16130 [Bacteroidota bacterium]
MESLKRHIRQGEVYRRSDLEYYSSSVDRHLSALTKDGTLFKLSQGLYYAPKKSRFGVVPPNDLDMVERFLKDDNFLLVSPNSYNALWLGLTQLYNTTWVYNHKRRGEFKLNGKKFLFKLKSSFPKTITTEFLIVDLLNNLDELAEDSGQVSKNFQKNVDRFDANELVKMAKHYGSGATKKLILRTMRNKQLLYA